MNALEPLLYAAGNDPLFVCLFLLTALLPVLYVFLPEQHAWPWLFSLSLSGGLVLYCRIYQKLAVPDCCILIAAYYFYRDCMIRFVHWVFFSHEKNLQRKKPLLYSLWADNVTFIVGCSIVLSVGNMTLWMDTLMILCLISSRIWLYSKLYSIFFKKITSCLHFFVYLCTLEVVPALIIYLRIGDVN